MDFTIIDASFASPGLQQAFRDYFAELGVTVRRWEPLFQELDAREGFTLALQDESGRVAGFLLGGAQTLRSDFFSLTAGFVEEMYVAPAVRRQGHGAALLSAAESRFRESGCGWAILTTDSAPDFFIRQGYVFHGQIAAKNGDPVFVKPLEKG